MSYNPYSLEGKTILVTGASSGIGKATAIECSKLGARVIITGRDEARLQQTLSSLEGEGHVVIAAGLGEDDGIRFLVERVPVLNGIVHAAGISDTVLFQFLKKERLENIFNINFFAPVVLSQLLLKKNYYGKGDLLFFVLDRWPDYCAYWKLYVFSNKRSSFCDDAKHVYRVGF